MEISVQSERYPKPDCRRIPTTCAKTGSRKDVAPTGTRKRTSTLEGLNPTLGPSAHRKAFLWSVRVCTSQSCLGSHDFCPKHCPSWHRAGNRNRIGGFRVFSDNHYTTSPNPRQNQTWWPAPMIAHRRESILGHWWWTNTGGTRFDRQTDLWVMSPTLFH